MSEGGTLVCNPYTASRTIPPFLWIYPDAIPGEGFWPRPDGPRPLAKSALPLRARRSVPFCADLCGTVTPESVCENPSPQPPPRNGEGEQDQHSSSSPPLRCGEGVGGRGFRPNTHATAVGQEGSEGLPRLFPAGGAARSDFPASP